ncbi:hypothetical protein [Bradyrhizobium sp.]|jgi:hypothetical protein|uniref:hypothetical protein n=1 Tax=Bradyrhizobium sp. TaxID=376 RepID=UPI0025BD58F9|nr:hypothetical protein [Bradyrhizobium sp.]MCA3567249.1 hypothetical protein [Bradyrhizobium sp.]MCA3575801.1 hypothetical protein [Bradyrhizobium sp.]
MNERTLDEIASDLREIANMVEIPGSVAAKLHKCADEIDAIDSQNSLEAAIEAGRMPRAKP